MAQLAELINYHEYCYYIENDPVISDKEFDLLYASLLELEKIYPESTPKTHLLSEYQAH